MGRPKDPRGRDRPRTVVLTGDVADIAQKLADENRLSSTISKLLRIEFGGFAEVDQMNRVIDELHNERQRINNALDEAVKRRDEHEAAIIHARATVLPAINERLDKLYARRERVEGELARAFDPQTIAAKKRVLHNIAEIIDKTKAEAQKLRSAEEGAK